MLVSGRLQNLQVMQKVCFSLVWMVSVLSVDCVRNVREYCAETFIVKSKASCWLRVVVTKIVSEPDWSSVRSVLLNWLLPKENSPIAIDTDVF